MVTGHDSCSPFDAGHYIAAVPSPTLYMLAKDKGLAQQGAMRFWSGTATPCILLYHGSTLSWSDDDIAGLVPTIKSVFNQANIARRYIRGLELTWQRHELVWTFAPNGLLSDLRANILSDLDAPETERWTPEIRIATFGPEAEIETSISIPFAYVGAVRSIVSGTVDLEGRIDMKEIASVTQARHVPRTLFSSSATNTHVAFLFYDNIFFNDSKSFRNADSNFREYKIAAG